MLIKALILTSLLSQNKIDEELNNSLEKVYDHVLTKAKPSVVSIELTRESSDTLPPDFFSPFAKRPKCPVTGLIISADGYILTSFFNIEGKISDLKVKLASEEDTVDAELVGYHAVYDVALLKINKENLPVLDNTELKSLKLGQMVFAIGSSTGYTINQGVLSALERQKGNSAQTDAKTNYGNTGGPLLDAQGNLIGMICKVTSKSQYGQNCGVGFALTHDKIAEVLKELKEGKKIERTKETFLGVSIDLSDVEKGVKIREVIKGTAADKAGVKVGDILLEFNNKEIDSFNKLKSLVTSLSPGDPVILKVLRDGQELEFKATLGDREVTE